MKNTINALLIALGLALPTNAFGQDGDQGPHPAVKHASPRKSTSGDDARNPATERQPSLPRVMAAVDANHDGILDADEIARAAEYLRKLDKNGDGNITVDELRPERSSRPRPMPSVSADQGTAKQAHRSSSRARLGVVDTNNDGIIDAAEIGKATQLLTKLDTNGDGKVTRDELRTRRTGSQSSQPPAHASKN